MGYRIEGEFEGPLLPIIPRAIATCKTCGPTKWQREDNYPEIKVKALRHCRDYAGHIVTIKPDNQQSYDWVWEEKQDGIKPPF